MGGVKPGLEITSNSRILHQWSCNQAYGELLFDEPIIGIKNFICRTSPVAGKLCIPYPATGRPCSPLLYKAFPERRANLSCAGNAPDIDKEGGTSRLKKVIFQTLICIFAQDASLEDPFHIECRYLVHGKRDALFSGNQFK